VGCRQWSYQLYGAIQICRFDHVDYRRNANNHKLQSNWFNEFYGLQLAGKSKLFGVFIKRKFLNNCCILCRSDGSDNCKYHKQFGNTIVGCRQWSYQLYGAIQICRFDHVDYRRNANNHKL
jgi:hypothetical protein